MKEIYMLGDITPDTLLPGNIAYYPISDLPHLSTPAQIEKYTREFDRFLTFLKEDLKG